MAYPASGWACDNPNGKGRYEPFHYQVACSIISPHPRLGAAQNPFKMDRTIHRYSPALPAKLISQVLGFWIVRSIQLSMWIVPASLQWPGIPNPHPQFGVDAK